ncbi:hypothetical protein P3339_07995 [Microbulbifer sp. MLAF003]|uniref:hypothetical protein n=1 Tax=Microbulbifer sp. MLAF003 TaxID=3032582 RepID=UPI0024AE4F2F|nr:hypothetical protein [Microbulbifer sp. MLAF003]WHI52689.1 hypothetical protein P3339_07995 [Microbulbifer sp. MLAF003]
MTIHEIRRMNARYLVTKFRNQGAFAEAADISRSQLSQRIGPNPTENIGDSIARRMEKAAEKKEGWLDRTHPEVTGEQQSPSFEEGINQDELMVAVQAVWDALETREEKITAPLLMSAAFIYLRLKGTSESSEKELNESISIARGTIRSLDLTR